ncbi:MAG: PKD domain-containing protein [Thermoanaerobaculia bacterium]
MSRNTLALAAALLVSVGGGPLAAAKPRPQHLADAGGEECLDTFETAAYFASRAQWYLATYGEDGVFNPERRLDQLRTAYAEYRRGLAASPARRSSTQPFAGGTFRLVGPVNGAGRMTSIALHPANPDVVWAGAAGGGCWKSTDGGATWRVLTEGLADLSVGAVAVAPSNPDVVYLGTGEGGYAGDFIPGIGVLRSTDGGETWNLPDGVVAPLVYRVSVDPRNADTVLAFTNNGVQRSTDGGRTWTRTSNLTWGDATDVARDTNNPDVLHATFWSRFASPDASKYAKSADGGVTWVESSSGLPGDPKGRMSVALSSDGATVYSMICGSSSAQPAAFSQLGLYRSTDGGKTWARRLGATPNILSAQGWYDNCVAVDPDDPNVVLIGGVVHSRSTDGGATAVEVGAFDGVHVDVHDLVIRRYGSQKVAWTANDGGLWRSSDGGVRWLSRNDGLVTRQYYSVAVDPTRPGVLYAGAQDNGSNRVDATTGLQSRVLGGDGFEAAVNPDSPSTVYVTGQYASLYRSTSDGTSGSFQYLAQPFAGTAFSASGGDADKPFYSWVALDPNSARTVYTGTYRPWRSEDAGETWTPLATETFDGQGPVYALAVAKGRSSRLLVSQNKRILLSDDRGASFQVLANGLPTTVLIRNVEIDPGNPDVFFVALAGSSSSVPGRVFRSTNGGASFARSDSGLPSFGVETVRVDPSDSRTVYAGTLVGLYRSVDGGTTWERWGDGLPAAAIHELRVLSDGSRVVVATHGRGLWISDAPSPNHPPVATILSPAGDLTIDPGQSVSLAGAASDPDNDPVTLRWDFGDGRTAIGETPGDVVFATPGLNTVTLIAEDSKGGRGGARVTIAVRAPNDACADAEPFGLLPNAAVVVRTGNGSAQPVDPADPPTCVTAGNVTRNTLWYTFAPPGDGTLDLDTFGSIGDTVMALFAGSCGSFGAALDCNDDAPGVSGGPSKLGTLAVQAGTVYHLLVGSWSNATLDFGPADSIRVSARFTPSAPGAMSPGTSALLPVVLDAYGVGGAHYTSDVVLLNRGTRTVPAVLTYGGPSTGENSVTIALPPGRQVRAADALAELRRDGASIALASPSTSQAGSLTLLQADGSPGDVLLASRTSSPNPNAGVGGTFGLFSMGTVFADAADQEYVYLFGLRQTDDDRSNLALVHVRTPHPPAGAGESITVSVEVFDAQGNAAPTALTATLAPGEWRQINEVLAAAGLPVGNSAGGWARIRRTSGTGRFAAYAVVNDQKTADGSLIPMLKSGSATADGTLLVPIVLETAGLGGSFFRTELVLGDVSTRHGSTNVELRYVASPQLSGGGGSGTAVVAVPANGQSVIPNVVAFLRTQGLTIPAGGGGALFVRFTDLDPTDAVYAGARITTPNPDAEQGGNFGVFVSGVARGQLATDAATVMALRQDASVRSNLAVVNAGEAATVLSVSVRRADGTPSGTPLVRSLAPGEWYQWSNVLGQAGVAGDGYAVVTRLTGDAPWYAYGVLNDARTSDGSVIAAVR